MLQLELKLGTEKNGKRLLIESTNDMKNFAKSCFVKAMEGRKVKATKEQAAEWFEKNASSRLRGKYQGSREIVSSKIWEELRRG